MTTLILDEAQRAEARSLSYWLFSEIFLHGVTDDMLPVLADLPELARYLQDQIPDERAAAHYGLFGMNVPPYASIFLSDDRLLGGATSETAQTFYASVGYAAVAGADPGETPDHIGVELGLLAYLSGAEAGALADSVAHEAARMRHWQRRFMDEHLLWWLPGLALAIQNQDDPFYAALASLALDLVRDHRRGLGDDLLAGSVTNPLSEPRADLLQDDKTSLKDIANLLLTPAQSGLYLSRDDITGLARSLQMPCGFGDRLLTLTNLFRAAADHDRLPDVCAALQAIAKGWIIYYGDALDEDLSVSQIRAAWLERLAGTEQLLQQMKVAAQAGTRPQ